MSGVGTSFRYDALDAKGQRTRGAITARSVSEASDALRARGVHPIQITAAGAVMPGTAPVGQRPSSPVQGGAPVKLSARDQELLFSQLAKMVTAGLSLERALSTVEQGEAGSPRSVVAGAIVRLMRAGQSPARAFGADAVNFDGSVLALIRSGELTGDLGPALSELERLIVARNQLKSKIRTALIYPGILGLVALGSVLTILLVVVPQFEELVRGHMDRLPLSARAVFWLSETLRQLALPIGFGVLVGLVLALRSLGSGGFERGVMGVVGRFSFGRVLIAKEQSAGLFRMLGTLVSRQVLLVPALDVARQSVNDAQIGAAVDQVRVRLKSGARLAQALGETGVFPSIAVQLANVGEETGDLGAMLLRAAHMLEDDLERSTKLFLIWFEPILLVVIGGTIGGLLYGLFSAILSINTIV
jgi:general secretion pathway protein F